MSKDRPLEVCPKCGWYQHGIGSSSCEPVRGEVAAKLMAAVSEVPSTKLGYGYRNFVFEPDPSFHIRLKVDRDREGCSFALEEVWLLDNLTHDEAADLVRTLVAWRARHKPKAGSDGG